MNWKRSFMYGPAGGTVLSVLWTGAPGWVAVVHPEVCCKPPIKSKEEDERGTWKRGRYAVNWVRCVAGLRQ